MVSGVSMLHVKTIWWCCKFAISYMKRTLIWNPFATGLGGL